MADTVAADPAKHPQPPQQAHKPDATFSILSWLPQQTRAEYDTVEQVLDLMSVTLTHQGYRQQLEQFYGFYTPLDNALHSDSDQWLNSVDEAPLSEVIRSALAARLHKTSHLQQDLHHLGVMTGVLPLCSPACTAGVSHSKKTPYNEAARHA